MMYINDLTTHTHIYIDPNCIMLYEDDAFLYTPGNDHLDIQNRLQAMLNDTLYWTKMNKR